MTILPLAYLPSVEYFTCLQRDECVVDLGEHFVTKRWQHQHWGALTASYASSPYFEHYAGRFEPFYRRTYEFLADYDLQLLELLCTLARVPMPRLSDRYVEASEGDLDLRPKHTQGPAFVAEPYIQVFSDRRPFAANLSFADLLFAEGPDSVSILARCRHEASCCR